LPVGFVAFLMTNNVLKRLPRHDRPHRLDVGGALLMMVATIALMLALSWGGARYAWTSRPILALLAVSAAFWVLFAIRLMTAREPFLPLSVLLNPVVGIGTASAAFVFGTMIGLTIYVPLYFEVVRGLSASESGLALIPLMGGTVVGSTFSGRAMTHVRHYKRMPVAGLVAAIVALVILAALPTRLPIAAVCALLGVAGLGLGSLFPVSTVSVQNAVPPYQLGTATGTMNFFRTLGGALIVALFGAIVLGGSGGHEGLTLEALATGAVRGSGYAGAFGWVFAAAAILLVLGLVLLLAMEERPLRGQSALDRSTPVAAE
jgi:sugar phosphate permease